jgi:sugar phosphate isomerase/epimerase
MLLSITTDFSSGTGCPESSLRLVSRAGFSHIHWCHQWCTDFLYCQSEIDQIRNWLSDLGLSLCDVHGSHGKEKAWGSLLEYERLAGLDLIRNRIRFAASLGSDVVIMHLPPEPDDLATDPGFPDRLRRSIDALLPELSTHGVRLAFENMIHGNFPLIERLLREYSPDHIGLCYDSGHGNMNPDGLQMLERLKDRLISVHLHDNDGHSDQHLPPFSGTVDWAALAGIIANSSYTKPLSFEVAMRATGIEREDEFLEVARERASMVHEMVERERTARL